MNLADHDDIFIIQVKYIYIYTYVRIRDNNKLTRASRM